VQLKLTELKLREGKENKDNKRGTKEVLGLGE
jgi:hypothetical protein